MNLKHRLALCVTWGILGVGVAHAQVTNGNFDPDLTGWNYSTDDRGVLYGIYDTGPGGPDNWTGPIYAAATGETGTLSQSLNLISGDTYTLSFYTAVADTRLQGEVDYSIGSLSSSVTQISTPNRPSSGLSAWTYVTGTFTATSSNVLSFTLSDPEDAIAITDVAVTPQIQATPEPCSTALGIACVGLAVRRRVRRTDAERRDLLGANDR